MSKTYCIETIRIQDGLIANLQGHNRRCNQTRHLLYGVTDTIDLANHLHDRPTSGLIRCRITYDTTVQEVEYFPYQAKTFHHFKLIEGDAIEYGFKYANRTPLEALKAQAKGFDEIIILKNRLLTDTSIANIAFYDGSHWITPQTPLLAGTMREQLIRSHKLITKAIKSEDLSGFSHFALMNAMIGFQVQKNPTIHSNKEIICL